MSGKRKVCVIGHFGLGEVWLDGQTVKTKIITEELKRQLGQEQVEIIDTKGGSRKLPGLLFQSGAAMRHTEQVVMLPARNGLRFFAPVLAFLKKWYGTRIHYIVIGGWLPKYLENRKRLRGALKQFDGIYVETDTMRRGMEDLGFGNVFLMPNCKELRILTEEEMKASASEPLKLCTFSRVTEKKGIENAVRAVADANREFGRTVFTLDIYGPVDEVYRERFDAVMHAADGAVRYRGAVPYDRSVEVLKEYFALLFPTEFYTEGIPGTIIDAFASGLPVISARWESFADLVDEGEVGLGYPFGAYPELVGCLLRVGRQPELVLEMKAKCLKKARAFSAECVVGDFIEKGLHYERKV